MWFSKKSARRLAMQADAAEAQSQRRIPRDRLGPVILIASVFFIFAAIILCYPTDPIPYSIGETALTDLISPVTFSMDNEAQIRNRQDQARAQSPPALKVDYSVLNRWDSQLSNLVIDLHAVPSFDKLTKDDHDRFRGLTPENFALLQGMDAAAFNSYNEKVRRMVDTLDQSPLVDELTLSKVNSYRNSNGDAAIFSGDKLDTQLGTLKKSQLIPLHAKSPEAQKQLRQVVAQHMPRALVELVVLYLLDQDQPLVTFDPSLTAALADRRVAELTHDPEEIKAGSVIAARGQIIGPEEYETLRLAQSHAEIDLHKNQPWSWVLARLGQVLMVLVLTIAGTLYVIFMNPSVITVRRGWALATLLILTLFVAKGIFISFKPWPFSVYLFGTFPVLLATIIMVVAFNQRFALGISAIHALIVTLALGQSLDFYLTTLTGIGLFVFALKEIRTRSKLVEVGIAASLVLAASVCALGFAHLGGSAFNTTTAAALQIDAQLPHIRAAAVWAAVSGFLVAIVAMAMLPRIEKTFKITTGSTLLELCDLNNPLLKRLAAEAQGTFNHSLIVGTLAEAAGNAIGANGLLCRVGAYYHDIGKLSKPQYFIENQSGGPNRHDKLSPAMSLLIIVGHVKDGIELAREYRLPWVVHQFIGQHHGTTLVEYFFHAARQKQARESESRGGHEAAQEMPEVSESEFRYPGPKPQTRETAILMICDGVESIVRSMPEPTAGRVETAVHQLVMKRLMDGQFSECDLTLRDLSEIEQALLRTLAGIYHGRVAYPKPLQLSHTA